MKTNPSLQWWELFIEKKILNFKKTRLNKVKKIVKDLESVTSPNNLNQIMGNSNWAISLLLYTGGMFPSVLLPDTVEDSWHFTTLESLHWTVKGGLWRSQWERHLAHTAVVLTSRGVDLCQLDQGLLKFKFAPELSSPTSYLNYLSTIFVKW